MSCAVFGIYKYTNQPKTHRQIVIDEHDTRHPTQTFHSNHISVHSVQILYVVRAYFFVNEVIVALYTV